ncbi:MAG: hypothetical protein ACTS7E_00790 [Arsenophonus sp. NC-CH8-MAG3]
MNKFPLFIIALIGLNLLVSTKAEETLYISNELPTFIQQWLGIDYRIADSLKSCD